MQIQKQEIRDEIISAASSLFAKKGVKNTSLKNIADKAHTTVGNIYNYFSSKEEILDVIAGQIDVRLDKFFESRFNKIIDQVGIQKLYELANILLLDKEKYDEINNDKYPEKYDQQFVALMEGCKGTKYEYYKESLINAVDNLWLEHIAEHEFAFFRKSISSFFIQLLLERSKQKLLGLEMKRNGRELFERCKANRDDKAKTITYTLAGFIEVAHFYKDEFWKMYNDSFKGIDVREYRAIFDATQVEQGNDGEKYDDFMENYCATPFKHRQFIFSNEQIVLMIQIQRALEEKKRTNYEIIIRHKVTQKKISNKLVRNEDVKKNINL